MSTFCGSADKMILARSFVLKPHVIPSSNCCITAYIYIYKYKYKRKHRQQLWRTSMNERTNTLLIKNISLTLYSRKGWCFLCVRDELETETDCYILTQSSSDHSSTSFSSWLGFLNCGSLRAASPQSTSWFSRWYLVPNLLQLQLTQAVCVLVIFLFERSPASAYFSAYLHMCISWLTARSRVNMLHDVIYPYASKKFLNKARRNFSR